MVVLAASLVACAFLLSKVADFVRQSVTGKKPLSIWLEHYAYAEKVDDLRKNNPGIPNEDIDKVIYQDIKEYC